MITEDYVSFETAKLLKEKGFDAECRAFYVKSKECGIELFHAKEPYNYNNNVHPCTSAPTLQMVMKWLREVHNLVLNPVGCYVDGKLETWEVDTYFLDCGVDATINAMEHIYGKTYEEACEAAIMYCLENLI